MTKYPTFKSLYQTIQSYKNNALNPGSGVFTTIFSNDSSTIKRELNGYYAVNPDGLEQAKTLYITLNTTPGANNTSILYISATAAGVVTYSTPFSSGQADVSFTLTTGNTREIVPGVLASYTGVNCRIIFDKYIMPYDTALEVASTHGIGGPRAQTSLNVHVINTFST